VSALGTRQAYLDGELCGVFPDGITSFGMIQAASYTGDEDLSAWPLIERKAQLA
jgi:hypothetical protein